MIETIMNYELMSEKEMLKIKKKYGNKPHYFIMVNQQGGGSILRIFCVVIYLTAVL